MGKVRRLATDEALIVPAKSVLHVQSGARRGGLVRGLDALGKGLDSRFEKRLAAWTLQRAAVAHS